MEYRFPITTNQSVYLMPIPTTSYIQIPQPIIQQLPIVSQPAIVPQPMVSQVVQAPLAQPNLENHFVSNYNIYDNTPRRVVKPSIFTPQPINSDLNDFRVRASFDPIVNPLLVQRGIVPGVNTSLPGLNTNYSGLNTGLNTGLSTGLNTGLSTGLNTGLNQIGNN